MRSLPAFFFLVAALVSPVEAQSWLIPTGKWTVDYGETQCAATREFNSRDGAVGLAIRPAPNNQVVEILVVRKGRAGLYARQTDGSVDFSDAEHRTTFLHFRSSDGEKLISRTALPAADFANLRTASGITIRSEGGLNHRFALSNMPNLLGTLEQCVADLREYWNATDTPAAEPGAKAKGDLTGIFSVGDYPEEALRVQQQGASQLLLLVNETGNVAACYNIVLSGVAAIDAKSCEVVRERAKFDPARDPSGKPIRSMVVSPPIRFQLVR